MSIENRRESARIANRAQHEMDRLFPSQKTISEHLRGQYHRLFLVTSGLRALKGRKILDLGCGAKPRPPWSGEEEHRRLTQNYDPVFSRFAAICGADVTGIDRRESPGENYHHIQADIANPATLSQFPDESFEIVNSSALLVAPHRERLDALGLNVTDPHLLDQYDDLQLTILDRAITAEVTRLLKEDGFFFYNESIYQKKNGRLVNVPRAILLAQEGLPVLPQRE